jgi:hypothetical protein
MALVNESMNLSHTPDTKNRNLRNGIFDFHTSIWLSITNAKNVILKAKLPQKSKTYDSEQY